MTTPKKTASAKKTSGRVTPKKPAAARPVTSAGAWKSASGTKPGPLTVPSGNVCLVRRPGLTTFMAQGLIPNSLLPLLQQAADGKGIDDATMQKGLGEVARDPKKLQDMLRMADAVTIHCVVEPTVRWHTWTEDDVQQGLCGPAEVDQLIPYDRRDEDLLYADEVDEEDKMFILSWAMGGDRSVDTFREEQAQLVESLSAGQDVGNDAEPASGDRAG